jgi:hypothetical protein
VLPRHGLPDTACFTEMLDAVSERLP